MKKIQRPYHHGNLRRALLDAVIAEVADSGSAGAVTVREAARRAGVSHSAPYRHFETKEDILAAVAAEGFAALAEAMRAAAGSAADAEERFVRSGIAYLRFGREHNGSMSVMFGPEIAKSQTEELQRRANEAFTLLERMALDAGARPGVEARRFGVVVWSFVHGLAALTSNNQVPPSVSADPEALAILGLRQLFRSRRALNRVRSKSGR